MNEIRIRQTTDFNLIELSKSFLANYIKLNETEREVLIRVIYIASTRFSPPIEDDYLNRKRGKKKA